MATRKVDVPTSMAISLGTEANCTAPEAVGHDGDLSVTLEVGG